MDERVRELLERVRETAVTVGEAAGTHRALRREMRRSDGRCGQTEHAHL